MRLAAVAACAVVLASAAWAGLGQDSELKANVDLRLKSDLLVSNFTLVTEVKDGRVVLGGRVSTLGEKIEAGAVVAKTPLVLELDNRITVGSAGRSDVWIEADVKRAFEDRPRVAAAGLRVAVKAGKVVLTGKTQDAQVRLDAFEACAVLPGVVEIDDRIETPERPDEVILSAAADWFGPIATRSIPGEIVPSVKDGVVTLEGTVPRLWERMEAARALLGIEGVKGIVDHLKIVPEPGIRVVSP